MLRKSVIKRILYFPLAEKFSYIILLTTYIVITNKEKERAIILKEFTNLIDFTILISEILWGEKINAIDFIFNIGKLDTIIKFIIDISNNVRI
jgi:hypothetical protein